MAWASAVVVIQPSRHGPVRSEKIGSKWSKVQADSNTGSSSATRHTSSIAW